jgi:hypothetical protein
MSDIKRIHEITVTRETYIIVDDTGENPVNAYTEYADLSCSCGYSMGGGITEMRLAAKIHLAEKRVDAEREYVLNLRTP